MVTNCDRCGAPCEAATLTVGRHIDQVTDEDGGHSYADLCDDCGNALKEWWDGDWEAFCKRYDLHGYEGETLFAADTPLLPEVEIEAARQSPGGRL